MLKMEMSVNRGIVCAQCKKSGDCDRQSGVTILNERVNQVIVDTLDEYDAEGALGTFRYLHMEIACADPDFNQFK